MEKEIIEKLSQELNIKVSQVESVLKLISEGNTIPFIARYRKEATGALTEDYIREIENIYNYEKNLLERKLDIIRLIEEKGLLTDELKTNILNAKKLVEVEDLYLPYKEKKKTKATEAIKNGLEPLAKIIMSFPLKLNNLDKFLNDEVKNNEEALLGASYIIAEWISDNASYRKWIRYYLYNNSFLISKLKKNSNDSNKVYEMYYDFREKVKYLKPYRTLAINRGEKENILSVKLDYNLEEIIAFLEKKLIKNKESECANIVSDSIKDSLKRLILPSLEREIRSDLTLKANVEAIKSFQDNLENLLLTPPIKEKVVLALDPGYRTGTKVAVVDKNGNMLEVSVIYPAKPHEKILEAKKIILELIKKYQVNIIAIGNGTASRENEKFISDLIKENNLALNYIIVNEAGASVYSASILGAKEFPDLPVEKRSAISLARRLQDSLTELVKIDPKSIGVGLYQHDMPVKELSDALDFTVLKVVNQVGVNINNASASILKYVSGLKKNTIENILEYKKMVGKINSREELKKIKGISSKVYEQAIGFLRIVDGINPLDKTDIHPDNYQDTLNLLKLIDATVDEIGTSSIKEKLEKLTGHEKELKIDEYTLEDIKKSLIKPGRDPRDDIDKPILRSDILDIKDLKLHDKLQGTIRNVTAFGAFVDIGLHNDGLIHISKISKNYIKHPSDVLSVGDIVDVYVIDIDLEKEKVSLSLFLE
ncbi:MAG: RNA-binding transcriptional accessory protein [Erysipelotrichaceae bacterium]|nr:RNA-binding transcriptional accessory protein [Erysipelotrichaceae bacterium]